MTEAAVARIGESVDELCDDLDRILSRVIRQDPVLLLERESDRWHTVTDIANGEVMLRAELPVCRRFVTAFLRKHPFSSLAGEPEAVEVHPPSAVSPAALEPASPAEHHSVHVDFLEGGVVVIPLRSGAA